MSSRISGNVHIENTLSCGTLVPSAGCISNSHVAAAADLSASKLIHRHVIEYFQQDGANIADTTGDGCPVHVCRIASTLIAIEIACCDAPTGTGTCTVDLKVAEDAGGLGASLLTGVITIDNGVADYEPVAGTVQTSALAIGDVLMIIVDETDGDGAPQGLIVTVTIEENAA